MTAADRARRLFAIAAVGLSRIYDHLGQSAIVVVRWDRERQTYTLVSQQGQLRWQSESERHGPSD